MVKNGQNNEVKKTQNITSVGFKPRRDSRLAVEVMTIEELRRRAPIDHFEKLQRADFFRLFGVLEGYTCPMVDFSSIAAKPGDWLLVRPGQVFRYDFSHSWAGWILVFRPDCLTVVGQGRAAADMDILRWVEDLTCLRSLNEDQHDWMKRSMQQLQDDGALTADSGMRNELLRIQLVSTLLRLSLWQSQNSVTGAHGVSDQAGFRRFRNLLDTDFATEHQVQYYAGALGMSEKTLSRICLAATGVSAKALITQRLVLEAKRLLAHTTMAVQTIGRELGFDDPTNFVKFFRSKAGMTPLAFRQD
jgi:AraC-like DNA-binding protein